MQLTSKRGTVTRTFHTSAPIDIPAEQRDLDRREFQLAYDFHAERRKMAAQQEQKDFRDMQRMMRHDPTMTPRDIFAGDSA